LLFACPPLAFHLPSACPSLGRAGGGGAGAAGWLGGYPVCKNSNRALAWIFKPRQNPPRPSAGGWWVGTTPLRESNRALAWIFKLGQNPPRPSAGGWWVGTTPLIKIQIVRWRGFSN